MPYASERQRRFMYAAHPEIADKWDREGENRISKKRKKKRGAKRKKATRRR